MTGDEHHPLRIVTAVGPGVLRAVYPQIPQMAGYDPRLVDAVLVFGGVMGTLWHPGRPSSVSSEGWLDGAAALLGQDLAIGFGGGAVAPLAEAPCG